MFPGGEPSHGVEPCLWVTARYAAHPLKSRGSLSSIVAMRLGVPDASAARMCKDMVSQHGLTWYLGFAGHAPRGTALTVRQALSVGSRIW
jgi:hypothetical protein